MQGKRYLSKEDALFDLAFRVIKDECPPDQSFHLCMENEEYVDGLCETCWMRCLFAAANGVYTKRKTTRV